MLFKPIMLILEVGQFKLRVSDCFFTKILT
jgi:hypothetical protein